MPSPLTPEPSEDALGLIMKQRAGMVAIEIVAGLATAFALTLSGAGVAATVLAGGATA